MTQKPKPSSRRAREREALDYIANYVLPVKAHWSSDGKEFVGHCVPWTTVLALRDTAREAIGWKAPADVPAADVGAVVAPPRGRTR